MIGSAPFYHATIKKCVVAFGNIFSGIRVINYDSTGKVVRNIPVPISYSNRQQWFNRLREDPDFAKKFEVEIPRIAFEITNYQYNPEKKLGNSVNVIMQNCGAPKTVYTPVPYRITFELSTYTKNQEDSLQILEQILPYFQPALNLSIEVLPSYSLKLDMPVTLQNVHTEDNYQDLQNNRVIIQTFTFAMDVQLFGPTDSEVAVIKEAIVDVNTQKNLINSPYDEQYDAVVNPRTALKEDAWTIDELWAGQLTV